MNRIEHRSVVALHCDGCSFAFGRSFDRMRFRSHHGHMRQAITEGLALIFQGIARLREAFPNRAFTIDGRLVGDIGEVIAALEYDVELDNVSRPDHDACTRDGRLVQIKTTFKDSLTFKTCPDYDLGFKLYADGRHEEVFNGPGRVTLRRYGGRKGIGTPLLSFPVGELRSLSAQVDPADRVPRREIVHQNGVY